MTWGQALVLGVVEGVTEYLPVSSTGHLILTQRIMHIGETADRKEAADAYAVCIQLGAILAVAGLYFRRIRQMTSGIFGGDVVGRRLLINLCVAFAPAAIIGLLCEKKIKAYLFGGDHWGLWPIAAAWIVGGVLILVLDRTLLRSGDNAQKLTIDGMTWRLAVGIGLAQCFAMWPGVSRSLATIAGGVIVGLGIVDAVEFSFLLGLVTLTAATLKDGVDYGRMIVDCYGYLTPILGVIAAGISAAIAVRWMVTYLQKHSMDIFGYYRIGLGVAVIITLLVR